jgi:hypothetical protein
MSDEDRRRRQDQDDDAHRSTAEKIEERRREETLHREIQKAILGDTDKGDRKDDADEE